MIALKFDRREFVAAAGGLAGRLLICRPRRRQSAARLRNKLNACVHVGTDDMRHAFDPQGRNGAGHGDLALPCCWPRNWSATGRRSAPNFPGVDRAFGRHAGRVRKHEHPHFLAAAAAGRRVRARNADRGRGAEDGASIRPSAARKTAPWSIRATSARLSYGSLAEAAAKIAPPTERRAEGPRAIPHDRQVAASASIPPIRSTGSAKFGIDVRLPDMLYARAGALPGIRRQGRQLRCDQSEGHARREARGADLQGRGGDRRQHLVGHGGPQGASGSVGRRARART